MGLFIGIGANIEMARDWVLMNNLTFPVLADSTEEVSELFTVAPPWMAIIDDNQVVQYTQVSVEDSTVIAVLPTVLSLFTPEIGASISEIEFGEVLVGETVEVEFYLENSRTGVLDVISVFNNNVVYSIDYTPGTIFAIDDSMLVTVSFTPAETGEYADTIVIESEEDALSIPINGTGFSNSVSDDKEKYPYTFTIKPAYPNPFNSRSVIEFALMEKNLVNLSIFNSEGVPVAQLYQGSLMAGEHSFLFDADGLPSGIYFYRLEAGHQSVTRKIIFLK